VGRWAENLIAVWTVFRQGERPVIAIMLALDAGSESYWHLLHKLL
jgi:hypothetical protein